MERLLTGKDSVLDKVRALPKSIKLIILAVIAGIGAAGCEPKCPEGDILCPALQGLDDGDRISSISFGPNGTSRVIGEDRSGRPIDTNRDEFLAIQSQLSAGLRKTVEDECADASIPSECAREVVTREVLGSK